MDASYLNLDRETARAREPGRLAIYVCPKCKSALSRMECAQCSTRIAVSDEVASSFTDSEISRRYKEIGLFYDSLYETRANAWRDLAGRGSAFISYVASLIGQFRPIRYLEIGCGQGYLLSAVPAPEKYAVEISQKAIQAARILTRAEFCQGCTEELPYPCDYFDVVAAIGVMEHFIDDFLAISEVYRVLREGGHGIFLCYMRTPLAERIKIKLSEYVYPDFRPRSLLRWTLAKCFTMVSRSVCDALSDENVRQPVQNHYTPGEAKQLFWRAGFKIGRVITKRVAPESALPGHDFRIYILEKRIQKARAD